MKCVREDFCDAKGVMVPFRVSLTEQEKRQRGTLIVSFLLSSLLQRSLIDDDYFQPCMQPSGSFAVCCTAPQEQQEVRDPRQLFLFILHDYVNTRLFNNFPFSNLLIFSMFELG